MKRTKSLSDILAAPKMTIGTKLLFDLYDRWLEKGDKGAESWAEYEATIRSIVDRSGGKLTVAAVTLDNSIVFVFAGAKDSGYRKVVLAKSPEGQLTYDCRKITEAQAKETEEMLGDEPEPAPEKPGKADTDRKLATMRVAEMESAGAEQLTFAQA